MSIEWKCHVCTYRTTTNCPKSIPPRLHICLPHWKMVPRPLQSRLLAAYKPGQERRKDPSIAYLKAAAACIEAVARAEGQPEEEIAFEVGLYEGGASMLDEETS